MVVSRAVKALLACVFSAAALGAQLTQFGETIDVRVINVDAVVTGPNGIPVRGLTVDDFELLVDGQPVPISYFAPIEDGANLASGVNGHPGEAAGNGSKPYLAIVWDQRSFRPKDARRVLDRLEIELPRLVDSTGGILVARQNRSLRIEQNFTRETGALRTAIGRLGDAALVSSTRGERSLLVSRLERAANPEDARTIEQAQVVQDRAEQMLREIHLLARQEEADALASVDQLRQLVAMLSNLPGRKSVLYFGQGVQTRPAEAIYRMWWAKYGSIAARIAVPSLQSQLDQTEITSRYRDLLNAANSQRVAFYAHDAGGPRAATASVEFGSIGAATSSADESFQLQQALLQLAHSTGGLGTLNLTSVEPLVDRMLRDFRSYYSLGFEATDDLPLRGRIELRIRHPGFDVRHFDRFDGEALAADLDRATMTALITERSENPLGASVEVGDFEPRKNGNFLVPLLVKVPISQLALLPDGGRHVGRISVVVLAQSSEGDLSRPARGEVPIEIDNAELLAALGRIAGYRLRMEVSAGPQTITIGLRDDVARTLSTVNLSLRPSADSG